MTVPPEASTAVEAICAEPANTNTEETIAPPVADHGLGEHAERDSDHAGGDRKGNPGLEARPNRLAFALAHGGGL